MDLGIVQIRKLFALVCQLRKEIEIRKLFALVAQLQKDIIAY
jgi:hypothetical protein